MLNLRRKDLGLEIHNEIKLSNLVVQTPFSAGEVPKIHGAPAEHCLLYSLVGQMYFY